MIDIYQSRRDYFLSVQYWLRNEKVETNSEYILNTIEDGTFYAKYLAPESSEKQQIDNMFSFDASNTTLKTEDNVGRLKQGDVVKFNNENWLVINVQKLKKINNLQYDNNGSAYYYLSIKSL